ncbi:solute carrier family 25 member 16-like [Convolutriloba macropyga]|uniref:solute carrier family 25 member 16-like n=1 Tax=Convolutriloba macropyga TaxID=536237 RepID=UPI003F528558
MKNDSALPELLPQTALNEKDYKQQQSFAAKYRDIPRSQNMNWENISKSFLAGGIAGCCAKTAVAPLDRTKILLQVHSSAYKEKSRVFKIMTNIYKEEGVPGLYRGNMAMIIRVFPYAALQFTTYEQYRRIFYATFGPDSHFGRALPGSCAGLTAVTFTYPLEFVRSRLAYQTKANIIYTSYLDTFRKVYTAEDGLRAFYRGITASWLGMIPYAGLSFYTFETLKRKCLKTRWNVICKTNANDPNELVLRSFVHSVIGGFAGAVAQTVSYPCDVTRRRMQLSRILPHSKEYKNIISTMKFVYKEHGIINGLYKGLSINYMRIIPQTSVSFTVYEFMKTLLNLQTGIPIKTG